MEIKVLFIMLCSILMFTGCATSINDHQVQAFHYLVHGYEHRFGAHAMPRKLMFAQKVELDRFQDKDLGSYDEALSGESHKASKVAPMQEGSDSSLLFTRDYTPVRKRRPVHNKCFPTTTTSSP